MEDIIDFDDKSVLAFTPEGKLLTSMLYMAVEDAIYNITRIGKGRTARRNHNVQSDDRIDAIHWLFDDNEVYDLCCSIAGVHKDHIRNLVKQKIGEDSVDAILYNFVHFDPTKVW